MGSFPFHVVMYLTLFFLSLLLALDKLKLELGKLLMRFGIRLFDHEQALDHFRLRHLQVTIAYPFHIAVGINT